MLALLMDFAIQSPEVIRFLLSLVIGSLACLAMAYLLGWSHAEARTRNGRKKVRVTSHRNPTSQPTPPGYREWTRFYHDYLTHAQLLRKETIHSPATGPDQALASLYIDIQRATEYADKAIAVQTESYKRYTQEARP